MSSDSQNKKVDNKAIKEGDRLYKDAFLEQEIALSPTPFQIFQQLTLDPTKNPIVVSKTEDMENTPLEKANETETQEKTQTKWQPESEEVAKEKIKNATHNNTENLYTNDFTSSNSSSSRSFWQILNSDIIWFSIAIALILGTILFYFQGLQPLLLSNYTVQSQKQVVELVRKYNSQISPNTSLQNTILAGFSYNPDQLCTETKTYQNASQDNDNIRQLRSGLFPDKKFSTLPNYQIISEPDIKQIYDHLYDDYMNSLNSYNSSIDTISQIPNYLLYRNKWVESCGKILTAKSKLSEIQIVCKNLNDATNTFSNTSPAFWKEIETRAKKGIELCKDVNASNVNQFQADWFSVYERVMSYKPDFTESNQQLNSKNTEFTDKAKQALSDMDKIYNDKITLTGIWYILKIDV